jgi:hypothetical protein
MPVRLLLFVAVMASLACSESFDKPVSKRVVNLGKSPHTPGQTAKVSCYYFTDFMVKEIDMGEKGADRLSITPIAKGAVPRCSKLKATAEKVIDAGEWSGYFKGVKAGYIFFDSDDHYNNGIPFAVYDIAGKKLFEDSSEGPLVFMQTPDNAWHITYTHVAEAGCVLIDSTDCWDGLKKKLGLEGSPPDCRKGYADQTKSFANESCKSQKAGRDECVARETVRVQQQLKDDPSIIAYAVDTVLGAHPETKPRPGEVRCWPAD